MKKVLVSLLGVAIAGILGAVLYFFHHFPDVGPAADVKLDLSQERVERGRYLAYHVAVCIDCHSTRNWDYYSGPSIGGTEGRGGEFFGRDFGFPGDIYSRNITPAAIGSWSDGELLRAITCGVSKDGRALFPLMPYPRYATADEEDIRAIAAYIRTLPPIENRVQATKLDFPMNLIVRTIPAAPKFAPRPPREDSVAYGAYLANMAACAECHTQQEKGQPLPGMDYAGGFAFILPWGTVRSSNITPDAETGIGAWSKEQFIARFKTYAPEAARKIEMKPPFNEAYFNTIMPWTMYAGMTEEDLGAIYAFLRTVRPVRNKVQKYSAEGATFISGK